MELSEMAKNSIRIDEDMTLGDRIFLSVRGTDVQCTCVDCVDYDAGTPSGHFTCGRKRILIQDGKCEFYHKKNQ